MGDSAKLRVVRCPKCENLLPELPAYSVYQCGACGAVLLAKKSVSEGDGVVSVKTEDFRGETGNNSKEPVDKSDIKNANNGDHEASDGELKPYVKNSDGVSKQKRLADSVGRLRQVRPEVVEFRSLNYAGEGTSRCYIKNRSTDRNQNELNKHNLDRDEILRKLDELKEQLSKSCDVNDKHKEKESIGMRMYAKNPHCFDHYLEPVCNYRYHLGSGHFHSYKNESQSHMYTRPAHRHISDTFSKFPCSCSHCYYRHSQHEDQVSPAAYRRYPFASNGPFYRQGCNSRFRRQRCNHPIAGGAPFVTCHDCNEVLELPKKVLELDKSQCKIRCGGCSSVISFAMVDEKLTPVDKSLKKALTDDLDSSGELLHGRPYDPHSGMRQENAGFRVEDYELASCSVLLSSSASEDEVRSPLEEHFDHSSTHFAVNRHGKGNLSSRNTTRQKSLKESPPTELDLSLTEYSSTGVFHDTADTSGEEDLPKAKRGADSFFAGVIKKSFRDLSKSIHSAENGKGSVSINGHLIPDRLVKKAEKLAGVISPGQYWYDVKAGFWGVMGGPCLGIIPPHIEEFSYPMPQKCAGGSTSVFVNGRELHPDDLDLLARRGLPVATNRSYIIEISGEVVDEDSGVELDSLGKLAPTVEKAKHGFGMKVPDAT